MRYWKPEDILTVACPHCRAEIEFWKDEPFRLCSSCRKEVRNPKLDQGCAEWCRHAPQCLEPPTVNTDPAGLKQQPPAAEGAR
jgi:hypothetical protein